MTARLLSVETSPGSGAAVNSTTLGPARVTGMVKKAEELAEKNGWFLTRQFTNEANADFHSRTTAQEILRDFEGDRLDFWVSREEVQPR